MTTTVPVCPYCGNEAKLLRGNDVYPHRRDLDNLLFWVCKPCDARVGLHKDGRTLGGLANANLRHLRTRVHALFDRLWMRQTKRRQAARKEAYAWLAHQIGVSVEDCHVGHFREKECHLAIEALTKRSLDVAKPVAKGAL